MINLKTLLAFSIFILLFAACEKETSVVVEEKITLQPNASEGIDAVLSSVEEYRNFGDEADASIIAVKKDGLLNVTRFAIRFNLSEIPENAIVTKAYLTLYFNSNSDVETDHVGDNYFVIKRITTPWSEGTISWQNQPILTTTNQITVPKSNEEMQDFSNINVTTLVKDLLFYKENSYGFFIRLQSETATKALLLASSDHQNSSFHPKLEISYILKK